jgi:hypothetical protein
MRWRWVLRRRAWAEAKRVGRRAKRRRRWRGGRQMAERQRALERELRYGPVHPHATAAPRPGTEGSAARVRTGRRVGKGKGVWSPKPTAGNTGRGMGLGHCVLGERREGGNRNRRGARQGQCDSAGSGRLVGASHTSTGEGAVDARRGRRRSLRAKGRSKWRRSDPRVGSSGVRAVTDDAAQTLISRR